jgi:phosphohistidine swiveling domain-containing protein
MDTQLMMKRIKHCMKSEDRTDVEFRALIGLTEVGDIVKYITHDPKLNPGARPHGTAKDEALAYGQALVQMLATLSLRGIDLDKAIELGLRNWEDADWRRRNAKKAKSTGTEHLISGIGVVPGTVIGRVYILNGKHPAHKMPGGSILVAEFAKPELVEFFGNVIGVITDHGGATSRAANIAREKGVISVVGTGNATKILKHGQTITLQVPREGHDVEVKIQLG